MIEMVVARLRRITFYVLWTDRHLRLVPRQGVTWAPVLPYCFPTTHTYAPATPSFGILISIIPTGHGIEDRNGIKETRDERPAAPFPPKSCLSEKPPNTQRKWGGAPPLTSEVLMWQAVWTLWAFIYFITDPGSAPAGENKADGMFLSVNTLTRRLTPEGDSYLNMSWLLDRSVICGERGQCGKWPCFF